MKFSLRALFVLIFIIAVAFASLQNHRWYNHVVAELDVSPSHRIKIWTEGYFHRQKNRKLLFQIWKNETIVDYPDVIDFRSRGRTDGIRIAYADEKRFICIYSINNPKLMILGDTKTDEFVGTFTLGFTPDSFRRHPFSVSWSDVFDKITKQNSGVELQFPQRR